MNVALFVPCYIDQFFPRVAIATLELLEKLGCSVAYPLEQTCCGQPMANAGFEEAGRGAMEQFVSQFSGYDYIVGPTGSCVLHVREHYDLLPQTQAVRRVRERTFELCTFLVEVLKVRSLPEASFPYRVGLHRACHGLRGLNVGRPSEIVAPPFDRVQELLELVEGIEIVPLDRSDECCGFGGTFAVAEEAVSVRMGRDRLDDHQTHGAEVITSTDMSCLMHLDGIIRREGRPMRVMHVAEILNGVV